MRPNFTKFAFLLAMLAMGGQVSSSLFADDSSPETASEFNLNDQSDDDLSFLDLDIEQLGSITVDVRPFSATMQAEDVIGADRQAAADLLSSNIVGGEEAAIRNTTDAGKLLGESTRNPGVYIQRRNPIISDPRVRGYRVGQYAARADGAFWMPARLDLDSILSKIDSKIIEDVIVINGPYSARHGPSFAVIDIATRSTPRSESGPLLGGGSSITYNGNGQQWNGNQYFEYGSEDFGVSVFYSHLTGSDYLDGAGRRVPASYNSRNLNLAFGAELTDLVSVEFRYLRQDQTDVELAGQFSDLDFSVTDGFSLGLISEGGLLSDRTSFNTWYNRTRAAASGGRASKQELFNSVFDAAAPRGGLTLPRDGLTDFDTTSTGYTISSTWGEFGSPQTTLGTDLRYIQTSLNEIQIRPAGSGAFRAATDNVVAGIPKSHSTNPGIFAEVASPVGEDIKITAGSRVDWVAVSAGEGAIVRRGGATSDLDVLGPDRENTFTLWSAFVTGDFQLTEHLAGNLGFGMAQRPPTLTELYAMRPFESVLQQGLNRIQGYPFLRPEKLVQFDIGLRLDRERYRGGVRGFHAWIEDYITSQGIAVDPTSTSSRITSVFANTPEATLAGGELFGEYDLQQNVSLFGTLMYVEGRNHTLNAELFDTPTMPEPAGSRSGALFGRSIFDQSLGSEPLPQIPPLEARVGLRIRQKSDKPRWEIEMAARIVDRQDRVASRSLLEEATPGFTVFDFRGIAQPIDDVNMVFGIQNITDRTYREHLDNRAANQLYQPGISAYFGTECIY